MIVFDLRCEGQGHVFEAWFGSSADYDDQRARGLVSCPVCGDGRIGKAVMAPRVAAKGNQAVEATGAEPNPAAVKAMLSAMAAVQKQILEKSNYVGESFANEARAIHLGEAAARSIYGKATRAETESLLEDGIEVSPLPFPVIGPGEEN